MTTMQYTVQGNIKKTTQIDTYLARTLLTDASILIQYFTVRGGVDINAVESTFFSLFPDESNTYFPFCRETSEAFLAEDSRAAFLRDC